MKLIILVVLFTLIYLGESSKILLIYPSHARSHYILGSALSKGLAEKGHDVTVISAFEEKKPPKKGTFRQIILTGVIEAAQEQMKSMNVMDFAELSPFITTGFIVPKISAKCKDVLKHPNVQELIKSSEKFDAVIVEEFFVTCLKPLATHFGAPLILFNTQGANHWINPLFGNPSPPSYIPENVLSYSSNMDFCERLTNTIFYVYYEILFNLIVYPAQNKDVKEYISPDLDLYDSLYNASIALVNSHPILTQAVPLVPNIIEIGGFHLQPPQKLPADLQKLLDGAKDAGAIYFSMGSNIKSANIHPEKREALLRVFAGLKQQVLWKWDEDTMENLPSNVKLSKWFPQQDILAHPNVRLFITHGGLLSTTETTYHGVPILAIPILADQKMNAKFAVEREIGLSLTYKELNEDILRKSINEILTDPKYRENAKKVSRIFHDQEVKPLDRATYWVEYVIRHQGAPHLRVAGVSLPWYKYHLLDVFAFLASVALIISYLQFLLIRKIISKFCKNKARKPKEKQN